MKKFTICLFLLFHFFFSFSQTKYYYNYCIGIYGPYWVTTEKDSSDFYAFVDLDTLSYGEILFFYKTGELFAKDFYDKQKLAESKHYYKNGKKKYVLSKEYNSSSIGVYNNKSVAHSLSTSLKMSKMWDSLGRKVPIEESYYFIDTYPNGSKMREGRFTNGFPDSIWKAYYENGNLMYQGSYNGTSLYWRYDYILSRTGDTLVKNGKGKFTITYSNNNPSYVGEFIAGHLTDELKLYYPNGKLKYSLYFNNGSLQGKCFSFYPDGNMKTSGNYVNGVRKGEWTWYNKKGQIIKYKKLDFLNYDYGDL